MLPDLPAPPPAGLPADLVARRPDLQAAERRLASARLGAGQSQANLYPRLSLTGGGGTVSRQLRDLLSGDFGVWNLIGNVTQPLFQGGSYIQPLLITSAIPFGLVGVVWNHFMGLELISQALVPAGYLVLEDLKGMACRLPGREVGRVDAVTRRTGRRGNASSAERA